MSGRYQLNVLDGDYGLVSLEPQCIQSILYSRIAKVPVNVNIINNIKNSMFYSAPSLVNRNLVVNGYDGIVKHLRTLHFNTDYGLSPKQCSESYAYSNMITHELKPALEFFQWVDQRNVEEFLNPWYMRALPLPFNYFYTRNCKSAATDLIESSYPSETDMEVVKDYLVKSASHCLSSLSTKLGKKEYYYGNTPTSLDIMVYAFIAPWIKLPFPSKDITNLINSLWPNLLMFVKRIDAKYFPDVVEEVKYLKKQEEKNHNEDEVSYGAIILMSLSAMTLLVSFALNKGIIKFTRIN